MPTFSNFTKRLLTIFLLFPIPRLDTGLIRGFYTDLKHKNTRHCADYRIAQAISRRPASLHRSKIGPMIWPDDFA
jgi:hypothetical protein